MWVESAPASADHSVDPLYCLLGLQSKICLEGALNFALCRSLNECSHDPDKFFLQPTVFAGRTKSISECTIELMTRDKGECW
jgi:hypothetical protein